MALCTECGAYFSREPDEEWKKLCIPCWKKKKFGPDADPEPFRVETPTTMDDVLQKWSTGPSADERSIQAIKDDNKRLRSVNCSLREQIIEAHDKLRLIRLELQLERSVKRPVSSEAKNFLSDNIKALLMLCHPDRHKNSKQATEVTSWLIKFKKGI